MPAAAEKVTGIKEKKRTIKVPPLNTTTMCLQLQFGAPGHRANVDPDKVDVGDAQKDSVHVAKDILNSDTLRAITAGDSRIRRDLRRLAVTPPLFKSGLYIVALAAVDRVEEMLSEYFKTEREPLIEQLMTEYPEIKEDARRRLGKLYDDGDYPTPNALRRSFRVIKTYMALETPASLQGVNAAVYAQEKERAEKLWGEAALEILTLLREQFKALVTEMRDRLEPSPDGGTKRFALASTNRLAEYLENFPLRNVTNDAELAAAVEQCRKVLRGMDADSLKQTNFREAVQQGFAQLAERAAALVEDAPTRMMELD